MLKLPSQSASDRISLCTALLLAIGIALGIVMPAGSGWDFANFYDAGHKIQAGQLKDLYNSRTLIEGKPAEGHLPYYGTPISALLLAPLAWLTPAAALVAFKIQNTAALLLALWLLYRQNLPVAAKTGLSRSRYRALFLVAALLFQPFWTIYRVGGQTTPTLFLGFVLALGWFTSGRLLAAAACLIAAISIKPAFVLMLGMLSLWAGARFLRYCVMSGLLAAALSILTMGWSIHRSFLEHIGALKVSPWIYNSSLSVFADSLYLMAGPSNGWRALGAAVRLSAAALLVIALMRSRRHLVSPAARRHWLFLNAVVTGLVLMPIVWEHYLSVLFIPVAYLLAVLPRLKRTEISLVALVCGFCFTQNVMLVLWLSNWLNLQSLPAIALAAIIKSGPIILCTVLVWRCRHQLIPAYNEVGEALGSAH